MTSILFDSSAELLSFLQNACETENAKVVLSDLEENEHATAIWDHDGPEVWLKWIESSRKGAGAEALHKLIAAADATTTLLRLSLDDDGSGKLEKFYASFGFVRDYAGGDVCERTPRISVDQKVERIARLFSDRVAPNEKLVKDNFSTWFGDSRVVSSSGAPLLLFHGTDTDFEAFEQTGDIGFHFGSAFTANARVEQAEMESGLVMPVYLSLQNPIRIRDLYTWDPNAVCSALADLNVITREQADEASFVDRAQVAEWLEAKGYDGLVYRNMTEGGGDSFIALHAHQVKSALGNSGIFSPLCASMVDSSPEIDRGLAAKAWIAEVISHKKNPHQNLSR